MFTVVSNADECSQTLGLLYVGLCSSFLERQKGPVNSLSSPSKTILDTFEVPLFWLALAVGFDVGKDWKWGLGFY
jgi:hypothetical protein